MDCQDCNPGASVAPLYARIEVPLMATSHRECRKWRPNPAYSLCRAQSGGADMGQVAPSIANATISLCSAPSQAGL